MSYWISAAPQWRRIRAFCNTVGTSDPWQATARVAAVVRSKSNQSDPPFNARLYCESFSIRVEDQWLVDCDARLLPTASGFVAEIQADHSPGRKQFSICHELAHVFFNCKDVGSTGISCGVQSPEEMFEERLCDRIAVELLMPRDVFRTHAAGLPAGFASVKRLADIFRVSLQAAMKRVVELNIWACGFVDYETSESGVLSVRYWRVSDIWRTTSTSCYSANHLGDAIRCATGGLRRLELKNSARSVQVEWYKFGGSRSSRVCAFLSAASVRN